MPCSLTRLIEASLCDESSGDFQRRSVIVMDLENRLTSSDENVPFTFLNSSAAVFCPKWDKMNPAVTKSIMRVIVEMNIQRKIRLEINRLKKLSPFGLTGIKFLNPVTANNAK